MTSPAEQVQLLHTTMEIFAHAKRFNERWLVDPAFRARLFADPEAAIAEYALPVDVEEARGIIEGDNERAGSIARGITAIAATKAAVMASWYGPGATASDPRIAAWRSRQQERMRLELGPFQVKASIRAAWHAELTRGCSGGCWFCNMAAAPLSGIAPSDAPGLEAWRGIVRALRDRLGPATKTGFLDGATDPFDHPDYEAFCRIVRDEAGFFPPTSTALALRDPERTLRFLAEAIAAGCWSVRFTVRDRAEFDAVHATFTSDELACVQLNTLTPDSTFVFSLAGRYRERYLADAGFAAKERRKLAFAPWYTVNPEYRHDRAYPIDANTGVVGFRVQMVERTVSLVTPRPSSDALPLGLQVLDTLPFADSDEFGAALDTLVARWMPERLGLDQRARFWPGLRVESIAGGVRLRGRFEQVTEIVDDAHEAAIRMVADRLQRGATAREIASPDGPGIDLAHALVGRFFDAGLLEEIRIDG